MKNVQVRCDCYVDFEVDDSIFTKEFMDEFNNTFFTVHSIEGHYKHIACMLLAGFHPDRIEGYPSGCIKYIADEVGVCDVEHIAEVVYD